jgi:hypothetical protein
LCLSTRPNGEQTEHDNDHLGSAHTDSSGKGHS